MNESISNSNGGECLPLEARHRPFLSLLANVFIWNLAATLLVGALFWWFMGRGVPRYIWGYAEITAVYANTYGFLLGLTLPYLRPIFAAMPRRTAWPLFAVCLIALTSLGSLIVGGIFLLSGFYSHGSYWRHFEGNTIINSIVSLLIALSIASYEGMRRKMEWTALQLRTRELEKETALKLASEARLASLESRLQPHFLFNTLNSISALIREDPVRAEAMLQRLAVLLRFSLDAASRRLVPMAEEMRIVANYLEIEKERLGPRLDFNLVVPEDLRDRRVPTLAVQTLVENSIKHAIAPDRSGGALCVSAFTSGPRLMIEVWDTGRGFSPETIAIGHGLDNLQSRLQAMFGADAGMTFQTNHSGSSVTAFLPAIAQDTMEAV